jgi:hypothetical protein
MYREEGCHVYDPYFGEIVDKPGPASRVGKVLLAIYLTGVLALVGLNLVMAVLFTIRLISAREMRRGWRAFGSFRGPRTWGRA